MKSIMIALMVLWLSGCTVQDYNLKKVDAYYNEKSQRVTINIPCYRIVDCGDDCIEEGKKKCEDYYMEFDLKNK